MLMELVRARCTLQDVTVQFSCRAVLSGEDGSVEKKETEEVVSAVRRFVAQAFALKRLAGALHPFNSPLRDHDQRPTDNPRHRIAKHRNNG